MKPPNCNPDIIFLSTINCEGNTKTGRTNSKPKGKLHLKLDAALPQTTWVLLATLYLGNAKLQLFVKNYGGMANLYRANILRQQYSKHLGHHVEQITVHTGTGKLEDYWASIVLVSQDLLKVDVDTEGVAPGPR